MLRALRHAARHTPPPLPSPLPPPLPLLHACGCPASRRGLAAGSGARSRDAFDRGGRDDDDDDGGVEHVHSKARVWVKPTHLAGAPYVPVTGVERAWRVAQLHQHVLRALRHVAGLRRLALLQLSLRLVPPTPTHGGGGGGGAPDAAAERAATLLRDPRATLHDAGVAHGCHLLADVRRAAAPRAHAVHDVTLRTDLLPHHAPREGPSLVARLTEAFLSEILHKQGGLCLVAELREGAPLLRDVDELCDGGTYYIKPARRHPRWSGEGHACAHARLCGEHATCVADDAVCVCGRLFSFSVRSLVG
jgi:hypothetical protein